MLDALARGSGARVWCGVMPCSLAHPRTTLGGEVRQGCEANLFDGNKTGALFDDDMVDDVW